ncbi:primosomal protein N' [Candidatus Peregrinibacteria bacterium]|nr:primosomal protein N' [Candidatus Peregrinibacteria bacterium]
MSFADIVINHNFSHLKETLTYEIDEKSTKNLRLWQLVLIPFRNTKITGIITKIHTNKPNYPTKKIIKILSTEAIIPDWQKELIFFMKKFYFCDLYSVLKLCVPDNIFEGKYDLEKKFSYKFKREERTKEKNNILMYHHDLDQNRFEYYKKLALEQKKTGHQTLILVAEKLLIPNFIENFQKTFKKRVMIFGSELSEKNKAQTWYQVWSNDVDVIIGSRSAIFLPFKNIGLIIMDQEHELLSYKQEQSPRYLTHRIVLEIVKKNNINLMFSSHSPRIETLALVKKNSGKYIRKKNGRFGKITIIDMREEIQKKNFSMISELLREKIAHTLNEKKQILLFLNRKGEAKSIACQKCGEKILCSKCSSITSYYRTKNILICKICNNKEERKPKCNRCGSLDLKELAGGTEKLESQIKKLFPTISIALLEEKAKNIENKMDIIIGTQAILKKENYLNVGLKAIILADLSFNHNDFRTQEESFQTLTNIILLHTEKSEILIQTFKPDSPFLQKIITNDYKTFLKNEIENRKEAKFPPFTEMAKLTYQDSSKEKVLQEKKIIIQKLKKYEKKEQFEYFIMEENPILIKKKYILNIILKGNNLIERMKELVPKLNNWKIDMDAIHF